MTVRKKENSDQGIFRGNTPDNPRKETTTSTHVSRSLHWKWSNDEIPAGVAFRT